MLNEKPSEDSKERMERVCLTCKGKGTVKPLGAVREALCQSCKGKGWTFGK